MSPAPDLSPGYPSGGQLISVAWQAAWEALADCMLPRRELVTHMAAAAGCTEKTAYNLVSRALRHRRLVYVEDAGTRALCRTDVLEESAPDHPALKRRA